MNLEYRCINQLKPLNRLNAQLNSQDGSALTEFAVTMIVLVPMFLMVPMLGKIADMNSSTIQASRYAAWERTVTDQSDKSDAQLQQELENRFFTKIDIGIQTGRGQLTGQADQNPLWRGYGGKRLLVSAQDDVDGAMQQNGTPGSVAGIIEGVISTFAGAFGSLNSNADFDVNMNGLYRADVNANVGSNDMGFAGRQDCGGQDNDDVFTCIRRHNVILADGWSSENSEQAESRTRSLVPMGMFSEIQPVFDIVGSFPLTEEFGRFEPGYVDSDVIAADRLGTYEE